MTCTDTLRAFTALLPLPPRALSSNGSHGHWATHSRAASEYRMDCYWALRAAWHGEAATYELWHGGPPRMQRARLDLRFVICRLAGTGLYGPRDASNGLSAFKAGQDALIDAGVIVGDDAQHLVLGSVEIERHRGHRLGQCQSGVLVTLTEVDG